MQIQPKISSNWTGQRGLRLPRPPPGAASCPPAASSPSPLPGCPTHRPPPQEPRPVPILRRLSRCLRCCRCSSRSLSSSSTRISPPAPPVRAPAARSVLWSRGGRPRPRLLAPFPPSFFLFPGADRLAAASPRRAWGQHPIIWCPESGQAPSATPSSPDGCGRLSCLGTRVRAALLGPPAPRPVPSLLRTPSEFCSSPPPGRLYLRPQRGRGLVTGVAPASPLLVLPLPASRSLPSGSSRRMRASSLCRRRVVLASRPRSPPPCFPKCPCVAHGSVHPGVCALGRVLPGVVCEPAAVPSGCWWCCPHSLSWTSCHKSCLAIMPVPPEGTHSQGQRWGGDPLALEGKGGRWSGGLSSEPPATMVASAV